MNSRSALHRRRRAMAFASAAFAACAMMTLAGLKFWAAPPAPLPNVVLVLVDTLRADALGSYGSGSGVTPYLDRVAGESLRFDRVAAQAPWTVPSISSLITSLYPSEHGQGAQQYSGQRGAVRTLPEILAARGYRTACFAETEWPLLRQGFGVFEMPVGDAAARSAHPERDSAATTFSRAIEWLRKSRARPFFLMVHTYEVHDYFFAKAHQRALARRLSPLYSGRFLSWAIRDLNSTVGERLIEDLRTAGEDDIAFVRGLYMGAVQAVDHQMAELDRALEEAGSAADTILVVTSDHGEGFQPRLGRVSHGGRLHEDLLHVPLLIRWPDRLRPAVVNERIQSIDLMPTILALIGAEPVPGLRGRSLLTPRKEGWVALIWGPQFRPSIPSGRALFAEESALFMDATGRRSASSVRQVALYQRDFKLIHSSVREELYDLRSDEHESNNLAPGGPPQVLSAMRDDLRRLVPNVASVESPPSEDTLRLLRALGYVK